MPDLTPDQTQAPTWGNIAMPPMPSAMAFYSPGIQTMGAVGAQTSFNAVRAQNLAAFDAFQKQNPNATAADLSAAAEHITGGDSLLGGSFTPAVMADIANKNRLELQSKQAAQQGDITATYLTAMEQAINTAADPADWVQKSKALMPQSSWGSFDSFIGGKNTEDMFKVYQQRRVSPIVKDGIAYLWDTLDKYTIAAGGNEKLGKMAMDAAMPQVEAAKLKAAEGIKVDEANIFQSRAAGQAALSNAAANREQSHAAALNSEAERLYNLNRAANEEVAGNKDMVKFLDTTTDENLVSTGIGGTSQANFNAAVDTTANRFFEQYGDTPKTRAMFQNWKKGAPATVAAATAARVNAQNLQTAQIQGQALIDQPTAGLQAQYKDNATAANALDQPTFDKLSKDDQAKFKPQAISNAQNLLAYKNVGVTDSALFNQIVADMTIAGKSVDEIRDKLKNTISGVSGLPVLEDKSYLQDRLNGRFQPEAPMNEPELKHQLDDMTKKTTDGMDNLLKVIAKPVGQGGSVADIQANYADVKQQNDTTLAYLRHTLAILRDRNRQGMIYEKDPATISFLEGRIAAINAKGNALRTAWEKRADLKVVQEAVGPSVKVNGAPFKVITNLDTVRTGESENIMNTVQTNMAQNAAAPQTRFGGGATTGGGQATTMFNPDFLPYLQRNPAAAKVAALAAKEVNRLNAQITSVPGNSLEMGKYNPSLQAGAHPPPMTNDQVGQVVEQIINDNRTNLNWTDKEQEFLKDQITKLVLLRQ